MQENAQNTVRRTLNNVTLISRSEVGVGTARFFEENVDNEEEELYNDYYKV